MIYWGFALGPGGPFCVRFFLDEKRTKKIKAAICSLQKPCKRQVQGTSSFVALTKDYIFILIGLVELVTTFLGSPSLSLLLLFFRSQIEAGPCPPWWFLNRMISAITIKDGSKWFRFQIKDFGCLGPRRSLRWPVAEKHDLQLSIGFDGIEKLPIYRIRPVHGADQREAKALAGLELLVLFFQEKRTKPCPGLGQHKKIRHKGPCAAYAQPRWPKAIKPPSFPKNLWLN